jgi:biopolymer transport protein ExbD
MSLSFVKNTKPPSESGQAIDVDITPVMNMFIILIPFLVSMAVFTQVSIIEFSLPPNVGTDLDDSKGKPKLKLTVGLYPDHIKVTHGENLLDSIPAVQSGYDYERLQQSLQTHRQSIEIQDEGVVAVQDSVVFKYVVRVMDTYREAGFEKVGLSSAAQETADGEEE